MINENMTIQELLEKLKKYEEALFLIYQSEYSNMNHSCYECATILANIAQDALEIPYQHGDFSIADRYDWEIRGNWTVEDEISRINRKNKRYKDVYENY